LAAGLPSCVYGIPWFREEKLLSRLYIAVPRNPANNYTLLHKPIVALNGGEAKQCECRTYELLNSLKNAGVAEDEISRAQREIEQKGQTEITGAGLETAVSQCCEPARLQQQPV
jgi:hypothetical protein